MGNHIARAKGPFMERTPPSREAQWQRAWPFARPTPSGDRPEPQEPAPLSPRQPSPEEAQPEQSYAIEVEGVYIISVAARLLSMHPQTLRKYERVGLVSPNRTGGMLRLYSQEDIARLRLIKYLVEDRGLNLAGVEMALELVQRLIHLQRTMERAQSPEEAVALVARRLDEIFASLNLSLPRDQPQ